MEIIDAQVHTVGARDAAHRPWDPGYGAAWGNASPALLEKITRLDTVVGDAAMVAAMDAVGVDAAILVATSHYGWDNGYSVEAARRHPGRFGVVGRIDHLATDVEELVAAWAAEPSAIGLRVLVVSESLRAAFEAGEHDRLLGAAERHGVPVCVNISGALPTLARVADRFPGLQFVIDHLGMKQPPMQEPDAERFERLPELLALADRPNIAVKITGAPTLSMTDFPYADIWPSLHAVVRAFGIERLTWGSDWTRVASVLTYGDSVRYMTDTSELNEGEKRAILGANARRLFNWPG